jgi:hypothetical protein
VGYEYYTRGDYVTLPTNSSDLETQYSASDVTNVSTKDNVRVDQLATNQFAIHQFKDYVGTSRKCSLEWEGQSNQAPSSSTVYLQIYNVSSATWEAVDNDSTTGASTDFILEGTISDLTDYRDGSNLITCRVYQEG